MNLSTRSIVSSLLRGRRLRLAALAAVSLAGGAAEAVFLVVLTRAAFAIAEGKAEIGTLAGMRFSVAGTVTLALALVLFRILMAVVANAVNARLTAEVTRDVRARLTRSFLRASWPAQQASRTGQLQELVINYSHAGASLVGGIGGAITGGCSLAALLLLAAAVDPLGTLVTVATLAVLGVALRPLRAAVQRKARTAADDGMQYSLAVSEASQLGMAVHVFNVNEQVEARLNGLQAEGVESTRRLGFARGLVPALYSGLAYLALVGAVGLASVWDTASLTSLGAVMLVMLRSLGYGQQLQLAYSNTSAALPHVIDVFAEVDRYRASERGDEGEPFSRVGPLTLDHVSFEYELGRPVLHDIGVEFSPGEHVGIVGPSGSGKSTLVQLLLGLREPTAGSVLADRRDIRTLRHADWTREVTFVPQAPALVHGSVADNIRFFREGISDAQVEAAARQAGIHDEIMAFPAGYAHHVGDRGGNLSGGQQQRVCIARALVGEPEVLILDEPTSALDAHSENVIRESLSALRGTVTVLVIAHRLSTLEQCDRIMIIQEGRIAAFDTPDNLRKSANFFTEALQHSGLS